MNQSVYGPEFLNVQRQALIDEKARLEKILTESANYDAEEDRYVPKFQEFSPDEAEDEDEAVDEVVNYEETAARVADAVKSLNEVNAALEKIAAGRYGVCEGGGELIPEARLKAYPAAATCIEHEA
jgi:DnaK suppressor protein